MKYSMTYILVDVAALIEVPNENHTVIGSSSYLFAVWTMEYHWGWKATELI